MNTPGTAVRIGTEISVGHVMIRALPENTGYVYVGDSGVSAANGLCLAGGDAVVLMYASAMDDIWIDAEKAGEGIAWLKLEV